MNCDIQKIGIMDLVFGSIKLSTYCILNGVELGKLPIAN